MAYPNYPGGYDPYPGGYASAPGGATAIITGVLACLGALANLFGGVIGVWLGSSQYGADLADYDSTGLLGNDGYYTFVLVTGIVELITAPILAVGAIMLFNRKVLGRTLIVAGCLVVIVSQIGGTGVLLSSVDTGGAFTGGVGGIFGAVFPIATLILALVPATSRWLAYRPSTVAPPGYPQPGYGYPQPGYPQPGYPQPDPSQPGYPQAVAPPPGYPAPGYPQPAPPGGPAYSEPSAMPQPGPAYPPTPVPQSDSVDESQDETWKRPGGW
ncbi:hypothetical protein [Nocardia sp. NPDC005366]|uniref:hypothetical protein n=1 Tax=Nocardia sp. NPDC005366 TaxID=3156878 RepID=UPI0033A2A19E